MCMKVHKDKDKFRERANKCPCQELINRGKYCLVHGFLYSRSPDNNSNIKVSSSFQAYLDKERQSGSAASGRRKKESDTNKSK